MKKIALAGTLVGLALAATPVHAAPGNGCAAGPGALQANQTCHYTATGNGTYVAATPNHYTIEVTHTEGNITTTTTVVNSDSLTLPATGSFEAKNGDVVNVTMGPDDAAGPVGGSVGVVAAADAS